ncbi:MAG: CAP domain-containing protein [Alphaproteobacteria bacterium]
MRFLAALALLAAAVLAAVPAGAASPESAALDGLNRIRAERGLPSLRLDARLASVAERQAADMAAKDYFGGDSANGTLMRDRVQAAGYPYLRMAVQLAAGYPDPQAAARNWASRRESREYLLDPKLADAGLGYARRPSGAIDRPDGRPPVDHVWVLLLAEPTASAAADWRVQVLRYVNAFRAEYKLPALTPNPVLDRAAQGHADDMARRDYFAHIAPEGVDPGQRAVRAGYRFWRVLENIAAGQPTPREAVEGWKNSDSHRAAMLDRSVTEAGIGYAYLPNDGGEARHVHYWALTMGQPR